MIPSNNQLASAQQWTMALPMTALLIITILNFKPVFIHSFILFGTHKTTTKTSLPTRIIKLSYDDNNNSGDSNPFEGFNPFEKKKTKTTLNPLISSSSNISLRQLRMKELMNTLLQNVSIEDTTLNDDNDEKLFAILEEHSELLLEPLMEENTMVDEDSIYEPGMTQEERFDRYDEVMGQRIEKAMNKSVKKILTVMKEYVAKQR